MYHASNLLLEEHAIRSIFIRYVRVFFGTEYDSAEATAVRVTDHVVPLVVGPVDLGSVSVTESHYLPWESTSCAILWPRIDRGEARRRKAH
jgi:hypothetical protein